MTLISKQLRQRPDFKLNTKVYYQKHTWRVAFEQPAWRDKDKIAIQDAWYRNRQICEYLGDYESTSWKTRADAQYFVYLTRPDRIPELIERWGDSLTEISGPINEKHQDIMLADLQVVTRSKLWYNKYRYKISSQRHGHDDQEIFEDMQNFCLDSLEPDCYKLNDTFRRTTKEYQKRMMKLQTKLNSFSPRSLFHNRSGHGTPYTATGSIYLVNHDDVVTLHMMYKQYITTSQKVVTFDELE
jgi:hypothetical protein